MSTAETRSGAEPRIGELSGDRLCAACCFNLSGQTIVREKHYGLLIVRCPECGTPAALQEYPLLGRWATRLGYVAAAGWLLGMMLLVFISALVMWRTSESLAERMAAPYATYQAKVWSEHMAAQGGTPNYQTAQTWWQGLDKKKLFQEAGGWTSAIAWTGLWTSLNTLMTVGPMGVVLAVATPHARRKGRLGILLVVSGLAGVFWLMSVGAVTGFGANAYFYYYGYGATGASHELWIVLGSLSVGTGVLSLAIGLWMGRSLARGLVRLFLPPRLRGPLAFLWMADGKRIPK